MARIKYFDTMANAWRYADSMVLAAPVVSVNGQTGAVVLTAEDLGAESAGAVAVHADSASAHADIRTQVAGAMMKADYTTKKAKLTLEDGSSVLIDVVVASQGEAVSGYTNRVPLSIDTDGSIFNGGLGYQTGYRLSSSGTTKEAAYSAVSGFIPAKAGDVVRITGCGWYHPNASNYLCAYKSDFTFIGAVTASETTYGTVIHGGITIDGEQAAVTLGNVADIAYIRVSALNDGAFEYDQSMTLGADMVVTINETLD